MLQNSQEAPSKHKQRKVSAIRQFPRGCGPNSVKLRHKPVSETSPLVRLEDDKVTEFDDVLMASNISEERIVLPLPALKEALDVSGLMDSLIPEVTESSDLQITKLDEMQSMEAFDVLENKVDPSSQVVELEAHHVNKNSDVLENKIEIIHEKMKLELPEVMDESTEPQQVQHRHCYSNIYGPPRRKKVSAIRQFPPGCRSNSGNVRKDKNQPVFTVPSPVNDKSLVGGMTDEVSKNLVGISIDPVIRLQIGSPKFRNFYEDKKPILQKQEIAGSSTLAAYTNNMLHADEIMLREKQSRRIDISPLVSDAENSLNRKNVIMNQVIEIDGSIKVSSSEKIRVADRKSSEVITGKETMIDKSILVRSNSDKNFRVQGAIGKSLLKSGSNVKPLMKSSSNKLFARSSSDKTLDGCTVDRAGTNIQTKVSGNLSHLFVKAHSGNKRMFEKSIDSMEKFIGNQNEISQDSINKRKLSATNYSPGKIDDYLAAAAERMIIQALMAAKNCPWKNSKNHSAVSSDSFVPKRKDKKEKRFAEKNPSPKEYFSFKQKGKGLTGDDDNMLDEDNKLCLTMIPFVPPESSHKGDDNEEVVARHKVKRTLRLFQLICRKLLQGEESKSKRLGKINRIDLQAAAILKDNGEWVNSGDPILGHVPGVEIGDEFHFRVELSIVGLHRPFQGGIDFTKRNGMLLANSIVASGGYQDDMDSSDVLIYSGSGGTSAVGGDKQQGDQKLERGNLSLKNSIDTQTPVRVIHGFKEKGSEPHDPKGKLVSTFTYDGLYQVESYWQEAGSHGFNVFKFQLRRMAGQPELALKEVRRSAKSKIREGLCVKDISQGKEKIPIAVINTIDNDQPISFKYITKSIYPLWYAKTPPKGCDCTDGCSDSEKCACAVKNGGEIPFNFNGAIVQAKPLIYECGPSCICPPSCHNRVSQRGLRMQLEIFKTRERGWGVRSLKSITSGSFICEYVGELLQDGEAEQRTNDEYLFDIGHNYDDRSLWEDLPNLIPGLQSSSDCDTVESIGFTIDAVEYGNVGRFINHSCSPNLYAQNVLYDHDDKRLPHIMFFAVDNIPPLQELTYHYNYTIGQVRDSEGNTKQKACHCGSPECCGRLY